jgi:hypothetical protein
MEVFIRGIASETAAKIAIMALRGESLPNIVNGCFFAPALPSVPKHRVGTIGSSPPNMIL